MTGFVRGWCSALGLAMFDSFVSCFAIFFVNQVFPCIVEVLVNLGMRRHFQGIVTDNCVREFEWWCVNVFWISMCPG